LIACHFCGNFNKGKRRQPAQQMCDDRLTAVAGMLTATRGRQPAICILFSSSPISLLISQFAPRHFDIEVHNRRVKGRQLGENIAKHNGGVDKAQWPLFLPSNRLVQLGVE
jgi:hypothetical protein